MDGGPAELVILVGLQASGKTTFYRRRLSGTHRHVSKDNFPRSREASGGWFTASSMLPPGSAHHGTCDSGKCHWRHSLLRMSMAWS